MAQLMEKTPLFSSHELIHLENPEAWSSEAVNFLESIPTQTLSALLKVSP